MPTDSVPNEPVSELPTRPDPLSAADLARIPGVLGDLARARARDAAAGADPDLPPEPVRPASIAGFRSALAGRAATGAPPAVVAEVKRASPSEGAIADLDPLATARAYAAAGAAAVSVLTEPHRFGGRLAHLAAVAAAVPVPALRKDFVAHPAQVEEAAHAGARAVLLIVAVLGRATGGYLRFARSLGLDALVEVHTEAELDTALVAGADLIGVNNRDLTTLAIDLATAPRLIALGRRRAADVVWIAESGYREPQGVAALTAFADAVLVGTHLAAQADPGAALRRLVGAP
jgi:indole-3-glycerol phosphate synthase